MRAASHRVENQQDTNCDEKRAEHSRMIRETLEALGPGPDSHRLDRTSFSWRTTVTVIPKSGAAADIPEPPMAVPPMDLSTI